MLLARPCMRSLQQRMARGTYIRTYTPQLLMQLRTIGSIGQKKCNNCSLTWPPFVACSSRARAHNNCTAEPKRTEPKRTEPKRTELKRTGSYAGAQYANSGIVGALRYRNSNYSRIPGIIGQSTSLGYY